VTQDPSSQPLVSVLLPNMNNATVLDDVLDKLAENTTYPNVELIVADDGSTDGSVEILRRWRDSGRFKQFLLLEREHAGIIPTLNAALGEVGGEVIVRIDGDTTVETPGWLERMLRFHLSDERIGVTVAKVILDDGRIHTFGVNVVGPEGLHDRGTRPSERPGRRTLNGPVDRPHEGEALDGDRPAEVDSALGCWTMFSTELARELGGFDLAYNPVWIEDVDFAFAVRARAGKKVFFLPDVRIIHHVGSRDQRLDASPVKRLVRRAGLRYGRALPDGLRFRVMRLARVGQQDPKKLAVLQRHYAHWLAKWGFDPMNPDLDSVRDRYAGTEVWWAYDDERRRAGEEIIARYLADAPA